MQVMIPEPAAQYQAQAPAAPNVASQDQISSTLSKMSRADLFNILAQMKLLIEQNSGQARHILVQNPQLTKALFQAQILLGMVQGPVQAQPGPGGPPAQDPAAHQPQQPPPYHGQASPAAHPAPLSLSAHPPTAPPTVFANGGPGAAANGFGAPSQGAFPAGAVAGQQQPYQQGLQHSVVQAQFPAALQQQQQQQAQASGPLQYAAAASLPPMQQAQQQVQQQQQQHSEQLGQQQPAQPAMGADQQRGTARADVLGPPQQHACIVGCVCRVHVPCWLGSLSRLEASVAGKSCCEAVVHSHWQGTLLNTGLFCKVMIIMMLYVSDLMPDSHTLDLFMSPLSALPLVIPSFLCTNLLKCTHQPRILAM